MRNESQADKYTEQEKKEARLVSALKNAEAIGLTLVHHGELMAAMDERINRLTGLIQTLTAETANLKSLYHRSLVNKYGTGPTA